MGVPWSSLDQAESMSSGSPSFMAATPCPPTAGANGASLSPSVPSPHPTFLSRSFLGLSLPSRAVCGDSCQSLTDRRGSPWLNVKKPSGASTGICSSTCPVIQLYLQYDGEGFLVHLLLPDSWEETGEDLSASLQVPLSLFRPWSLGSLSMSSNTRWSCV